MVTRSTRTTVTDQLVLYKSAPLPDAADNTAGTVVIALRWYGGIIPGCACSDGGVSCARAAARRAAMTVKIVHAALALHRIHTVVMGVSTAWRMQLPRAISLA